MTKEKMILHLIALYRLGNRSDHDDRPADEAWTHHTMAGPGMCSKLDEIMYHLLECDVLTSDEHQEIYDNL